MKYSGLFVQDVCYALGNISATEDDCTSSVPGSDSNVIANCFWVLIISASLYASVTNLTIWYAVHANSLTHYEYHMFLLGHKMFQTLETQLSAQVVAS
jgi:hypothetical protein